MAISCSLPALTTLAIEASGPGVWPRDSAVMLRKRVYFSPSLRTYQSARRSRIAVLSRAGSPSTSSVRASASRSAASGPGASPTARRSFISVVIETFQPAPTAPRRCASGMRTSVKKTSLKLEVPEICLMRRTSTPGDFMSRKNMVRPSCLAAPGSVRTSRMP